jgi:hypothetical protein
MTPVPPTPIEDPIQPEPPATVGPIVRIIRTWIYVIVGVLAAVPTTLAAIDIPDKYKGYILATCSIMGAIVGIITTAVNLFEHATGKAFLASKKR